MTSEERQLAIQCGGDVMSAAFHLRHLCNTHEPVGIARAMVTLEEATFRLAKHLLAIKMRMLGVLDG